MIWVYVGLSVVGIALGLWLSRMIWSRKPKDDDKQALIAAEKQAKDLVAQHGAEKATVELLMAHRETVAKLDDKQKVEAEALKNDPIALSKFLVGAGK